MSALDDSDLRNLLGDVLVLINIETDEDDGSESGLTEYMKSVARAAADELSRRDRG